MKLLWYIVDAATGIQHCGPYETEAEALLACADKYNELPDRSDVEFVVEPGSPDGPWAHAIPVQSNRR